MLKKLFNPKAGALSSLIAPHFFATESLFLTKQSALGAVYKLTGVDFECLTDEALESITTRLHTALRNLSPDFRIYQYVIKRKGVNLAYHRASELYSFELFWVLLYEQKRGGMIGGNSLKVSQKDLDARIADVTIHLANFQDTAKSILGLQLLERDAVFSFFQALLFSEKRPLQYRDHIDYWAAQTAIDVNGTKLEVGGAILPMSLRGLPRTTAPNLFIDLLRLPCDLILCSEFKRMGTEQAIRLIEKSEEHFFYRKNNRNSKETRKRKQTGEGIEDKASKEDVSDLGDFGVRVKNRGEFVGEYSFRLILSGTNLARHAAEARSIAGNVEAQLEVDTIGALDSYLSIIPGNTSRNIAALRHANLSMNYADMALIYAPPVGDPINRHLGKEALTILESSLGTPVYFNLHEGDLMGALIFGVMGSGKSFLTNLLIDKAQKYDQFTFVIDIGGSYKHLSEHHGGTFIALAKRRQKFTINPFDCEKTEENLEFLSSFVHVLLATSGYTASPKECQAIDKAVKIATRLSDLNLSDSLMERLYNWIGDGRYSYLFDNEKDTLSLARFQAFDFQGVSENVVEPLFFYLFNKISQVVYDPQNVRNPKVLYCDEVWKLLENPHARSYVVGAGKTWRKHNGGICLTTQSALDMEKVGLLDVVNEICLTKILLANPGANKQMYQRIFELNEKELELFSDLTPKQQFLLKTPRHSAVLSVMPSQEEYWTYANDPNSNRIREEQGMDALTKGAAA
jgi:type IV secretory pathway VirB4 component